MNGAIGRYYAKGRLKAGKQNKTEAAYQLHLEALRQAGEVAWFKFEGIRLVSWLRAAVTRPTSRLCARTAPLSFTR